MTTIFSAAKTNTFLRYAPRSFVSQRRTLLSWLRGGGDSNSTKLEMDDDFGPLKAKDFAKERSYPKVLWNQHPVSVSAVCGYRSYMEDDFVIAHNVCGVFDGHGGRHVSAYLAQNLPAELQTALPDGPTLEDHERALRKALQHIDEKVLQIRHWSYQGSTAVVLYLTPHGILVANIGDSRAVLSHQSRAVALTKDHKPNDLHEWTRIEAMGGTVEFDGYVDPQGVPFGCYRVNGNLAMSRAIGDRSERPIVIAEPDICCFELSSECEFVVLATDGLWDVMDNEEVVQYIHKYGQRDEVASWLVEEALRRGSLDNITVVIVWFRHAAKVEEDF